MRKLLIATLFAATVAFPGGTAVAGHCFDGHPGNGELPPDWDCDVFHESAAMVTGTGTITPGLPASGCAPQLVTFSGTAVKAGGGASVYSVSFNGGSDGCETLAAGQGSGELSGDVDGTVAYVRSGSVVTIAGQVVVNGALHVIRLGDCLLVPTSVNPVITYGFTCAVALHAV